MIEPNVLSGCRLADFRAFVLNPWALAQYAHNMAASVVTASFVVAAAGAHYALSGRHLDHARRFLALGTRAGVIASLLVAFPTGDHQAKLIARFQPGGILALINRQWAKRRKAPEETVAQGAAHAP